MASVYAQRVPQEPVRTWTVTRTWRGVQGRTTTDALAAAQPGEHVDTVINLTGSTCQVTTLAGLLNTDAEPDRCGDSAVCRVVLDYCSSLTCTTTKCHGHEVCRDHLKQLVEDDRVDVKHLIP